MKRQKFETRRIELREHKQVERAIEALIAAPLDNLNPLEFLLQEKPKKRGLDQNGYYWLRLGEIAKAAGYRTGQQFTAAALVARLRDGDR